MQRKAKLINKQIVRNCFLGLVGLLSITSISVTSYAATSNKHQAATSSASNSLEKNNPLLTGLSPVFKKVMPSIVNISVQGELPPRSTADQDQPSRNRNIRVPSKPRKFESIGSGVILDAKKGYIITNAHVIRNGQTITVTVSDGRRLKAKLIGADPVTDIAVLQVKAKHLESLPLGDSNNVHVGDFVIAIGNPFGLHHFGGSNQTATFGIVSALQRSDLNIEGVENFIQTDAAINPGNSGGALINMRGQLIGINTAIISPYGGNIGIGFAIPIDMAHNVMRQIVKYGSVHRGMMGIFVQPLTPELADAFGISNAQGALVTQVNPDTPASAAEVKSGDVITSINGIKITQANQVRSIVSLIRVGNKVHLDVLRRGKPIKLVATVTDRKQHLSQLSAQNPFLYGLGLKDFAQDSPLHGFVQGVQIVGASENSAAWRSGLRPGDVIVSADQHDVSSIKQLRSLASNSKGEMLVHILRGPGSLYFVVK